MTADPPMFRAPFSRAMGGSFVLHGLLVALTMVSWGARDLKVGAVVPVNIVTNAPATDLRAAEQAPEVQTAQTEDPVPEAPPEVTPPPPPKAQPAPTPPVKTAKPVEKIAPAKAQPTPKVEKGLDFDSLAASLSKSTRSQPPRPSSAARGAARPETALQARPDLGSGQAAAAVSGMAEAIQRYWNPNCAVEGGRDVKITVRFRLGLNGQVSGKVTPEILSANLPVAQAAAERAVRAVYAAAPFRGLPTDYYGPPISLSFNAREACS